MSIAIQDAPDVDPFSQFSSGAAKIIEVERSSLQINCGCQMRSKLDQNNRLSLARHLDEGIELDPITVVEDPEGKRYVIDGYHRIAAYDSRGITRLKAAIIQGSLDYAQHLAAAANAKTSLKRDSETIKKSILHCLQAEETKRWTDARIARHVGTSRSSVQRRRNELQADGQVAERSTVVARRNGKDLIMSAKPKGSGKGTVEQPSDVDPSVPKWYNSTPNFKVMTPEENKIWLNWIIEEYESFGAVERAPFRKEPNAFVVKWLEDGHFKRSRFSGLRQAYEAWQKRYFDYPQRPDITKPEPQEELWPSTTEVMQPVDSPALDLPKTPTVAEVVGEAAIAQGPRCGDIVTSLLNRFGPEGVVAVLVDKIEFQELMDLIQAQYEAKLAS